MTPDKNELDELKDMEGKAAELRRKRKQKEKEIPSEAEDQPDPEAGSKEAPDPDGEDEIAEVDEDIMGLTAHIDNIVGELEVLARKHPSLALVSAFTAGFLAGKLFTRR